MRGVPGWKRHRLTGFGVPPGSRRAETEQEAAEASDLDSPTTGETRRHLVEHNLHRELNVALYDLGLLLRNPLDQIRLRHRPIIAPALCDRDPRRRPPRSTAAKVASSSASVPGNPAARLRGANSDSTHKSRVVGIRTPNVVNEDVPLTCRAQKLHPGPNRPLIDLMQPTENRLRRGRVFSGARGGLHHVYHWPATARMRFLRPTTTSEFRSKRCTDSGSTGKR